MGKAKQGTIGPGPPLAAGLAALWLLLSLCLPGRALATPPPTVQDYPALQAWLAQNPLPGETVVLSGPILLPAGEELRLGPVTILAGGHGFVVSPGATLHLKGTHIEGEGAPMPLLQVEKGALARLFHASLTATAPGGTAARALSPQGIETQGSCLLRAAGENGLALHAPAGVRLSQTGLFAHPEKGGRALLAPEGAVLLEDCALEGTVTAPALRYRRCMVDGAPSEAAPLPHFLWLRPAAQPGFLSLRLLWSAEAAHNATLLLSGNQGLTWAQPSGLNDQNLPHELLLPTSYAQQGRWLKLALPGGETQPLALWMEDGLPRMELRPEAASPAPQDPAAAPPAPQETLAAELAAEALTAAPSAETTPTQEAAPTAPAASPSAAPATPSPDPSASFRQAPATPATAGLLPPQAGEAAPAAAATFSPQGSTLTGRQLQSLAGTVFVTFRQGSLSATLPAAFLQGLSLAEEGLFSLEMETHGGTALSIRATVDGVPLPRLPGTHVEMEADASLLASPSLSCRGEDGTRVEGLACNTAAGTVAFTLHAPGRYTLSWEDAAAPDQPGAPVVSPTPATSTSTPPSTVSPPEATASPPARPYPFGLLALVSLGAGLLAGSIAALHLRRQL